MVDWQSEESVGATFAQAPGCIEFQMDAGKVNTQEGWHDFKICTFAKRPQADPATPDEWDTRVLPKLTARITVVALESIEVFEKRLRPLAAHLGIQDTRTIHTLGDGAEWIWNAATRQFPGGPQTLDVYHGCEWISDTSKLLYPQTYVCASQPKGEEATSPAAGDTMLSPAPAAMAATPTAVTTPTATAATPTAVTTPTATAATPAAVTTAATLILALMAAAPALGSRMHAATGTPRQRWNWSMCRRSRRLRSVPGYVGHPGENANGRQNSEASFAEIVRRRKGESEAGEAVPTQAGWSEKPKSEHEKSYEQGRSNF